MSANLLVGLSWNRSTFNLGLFHQSSRVILKNRSKQTRKTADGFLNHERLERKENTELIRSHPSTANFTPSFLVRISKDFLLVTSSDKEFYKRDHFFFDYWLNIPLGAEDCFSEVATQWGYPEGVPIFFPLAAAWHLKTKWKPIEFSFFS